jgi:hypothetical protein
MVLFPLVPAGRLLPERNGFIEMLFHSKLPTAISLSQRTAFYTVACVITTVVFGCLGPAAVTHTRTKYNEVYRNTNDEQILLNIVRLRYADSPVFVDLPNITSQFELSGLGSYMNGIGNQFPGQASLGMGQLSVRDTPTISYHPRSGNEIARALLTPLSAELFSIVNAGANIDQFMLMTVNDINDVDNAAHSIAMIPHSPSDNLEFRHGIELLSNLEERGMVELTMRKLEDSDSSDPILLEKVGGGDLINASKENYVFRESGEKHMTVHKQEKTLVLRVRTEHVNSPEMLELARIFRLKPGLSLYKIKSELSGEHPDRKSLAEDLDLQDTLFINMRSILQVAIFLSKGVCVPDEHLCNGVAPWTLGPDGQMHDWTQLTNGLFHVCVQKRRPKESEVAVQYRGYWFYVESNDVNSRAVLAILEILFSVQESEGKPAGPLLSIPLGG